MLLCILNRCEALCPFVRCTDHPTKSSQRREQVQCRQTKECSGHEMSQVLSGGQNLLKSGCAWLQSCRQPHCSCLAGWQATAVFLKERPWGISCASHQSHGIHAEADGVNGVSQASQRVGSVQTLVNLPLITIVCLKGTQNARL